MKKLHLLILSLIVSACVPTYIEPNMPEKASLKIMNLSEFIGIRAATYNEDDNCAGFGHVVVIPAKMRSEYWTGDSTIKPNGVHTITISPNKPFTLAIHGLGEKLKINGEEKHLGHLSCTIATTLIPKKNALYEYHVRADWELKKCYLSAYIVNEDGSKAKLKPPELVDSKCKF